MGKPPVRQKRDGWERWALVAQNARNELFSAIFIDNFTAKRDLFWQDLICQGGCLRTGIKGKPREEAPAMQSLAEALQRSIRFPIGGGQ